MITGNFQQLSYALPATHLPAATSDWPDYEMERAREVQNRTFTTARPRVSGLDYFSDWRPAHGLSGDYLDYFQLPEGNLGLAIGDVAGKGLAAALLSSSLHSMARALRHYQHGSLSDLTATLDEMFYEICPDSSYATMFVARYDPTRRFLHYVNAGHEPPMVLRKTATGYRPIALEPTGPVIGMLRKSRFYENVVSLAPGDLLIAYTDGLCEATDVRGEEWGFRRMMATVQSCSYRKARDIVERVLESAETFAGASPRHDDMTLWVGRIDESACDTLPFADEVDLLAVA